MTRIHGVAAGTRWFSTAASVPHSPLAGSEAQLIQDTLVGAGTNPLSPSPLVLMWQKRALLVEWCTLHNQPCTGSGMDTQLSTHQAVVRKKCWKLLFLTQQLCLLQKMKTFPLAFWASLAQQYISVDNFLFFSTLFAPKPKTECSIDDIKYILKNIFFRQCWRTFCNYCDCLKLFWKLPALDWKWKFCLRSKWQK